MKKFSSSSPEDWKFIDLVSPILLLLAIKKYPDTKVIYEFLPSKKENTYCIKCLICDEILYIKGGKFDDVDHMLNHVEEHKTLLNML